MTKLAFPTKKKDNTGKDLDLRYDNSKLVKKEQEMYWPTDDNLRKLLRYKPSIDRSIGVVVLLPCNLPFSVYRPATT